MLFHKFNSLVWERQGQVAPRSIWRCGLGGDSVRAGIIPDAKAPPTRGIVTPRFPSLWARGAGKEAPADRGSASSRPLLFAAQHGQLLGTRTAVATASRWVAASPRPLHLSFSVPDPPRSLRKRWEHKKVLKNLTMPRCKGDWGI